MPSDAADGVLGGELIDANNNKSKTNEQDLVTCRASCCAQSGAPRAVAAASLSFRGVLEPVPSAPTKSVTASANEGPTFWTLMVGRQPVFFFFY